MFGLLKRNAIVHLSLEMWRYATGYRAWVVLYATLACFAIIVNLCVPLVTARFMNAVQNLNGNELIAQAVYLIGIFLLLEIFFWLLHGPSRVIETIIAFRVRRSSQHALLKKSAALPMRWHRDHHSGEIIDQVDRAIDALTEFTDGGFEVIHLLTRFTGAVAILFWIMPAAGLSVVAIGILAIVSIILFDRMLIKQYMKLNRRFNEIAAAIQDYMTNIATVKSLRLEDRVTSEVTERTDRILSLYRKNSMLTELKWFTSSCFVEITRVGVLLMFVLAMVKSDQVIEIGTVYALHEYLRSIGDSFFQFTYKYGELVKKSARVRATEHIEESFDRLVRKSAEASLPKNWKSVNIQNLRFSHAEEDAAAQRTDVNDVSFKLERGKSYALVGESGSGKSTVLGLLRGIHPAKEVQVSCGDKVLPYGMAHVSHHTTLIPQDPEIFSDTILFNVTLGIEASEQEVLKALEFARFEPVLRNFKKGLGTSIAEKGVSLSGGERQRLALARGLFFAEESNSQIVLLDEPTSSVDIFNERHIYEDLLQHFKDRCVLSAIHRYNLLHLFDEILFFQKGQLIEAGSLEQLITANGEFSHLWNNYILSNSVERVTA